MIRSLYLFLSDYWRLMRGLPLQGGCVNSDCEDSIDDEFRKQWSTWGKSR